MVPYNRYVEEEVGLISAGAALSGILFVLGMLGTAWVLHAVGRSVCYLWFFPGRFGRWLVKPAGRRPVGQTHSRPRVTAG